MDLNKLLCCMFLFHFLALTVHKYNSSSLRAEEQTTDIETFRFRNLCIAYDRKTNDWCTVVDLPI